MELAAGNLRAIAAGTMLDDKYRIDGLIAVGGMGAVYQGTHTKLRKRVAIKVLNPELNTPTMLERFHREAITASQIGHEGIAQVTDIGTSVAGEPFLVMELLEGESLATRLRSAGPLPIDVACELACSILSPLGAAHAAGIVHRDLKPDNVYLVRQSRGEMVKLLDFGISRSASQDGEFRLTTTGLVLGTPFYMSPEQARGDTDIRPAADIYALGVVLYEMLVGQVPVSAENYNQLMYRVMTADFVRPRERRPEIPEQLEQIILVAMALEPAHRPSSAEHLERALLPFCRLAFSEHTMDRLSQPRLIPRATPAPSHYTPGGSAGTDRTVLAPPNAPSAMQLIASRLDPAAPTAAPTAPRKSSAVRVVLVAVAVLVAGGVAAAVVLGRTTAAVTEPAEPPVAGVSPRGAPAAAPPDAHVVRARPVPRPEVHTLEFDVTPRDALITLDGAAVTGAEVEVTRDSQNHDLAVTAPGYRDYVDTVRYDQSQRLVIKLDQATTTTAAKTPTGKTPTGKTPTGKTPTGKTPTGKAPTHKGPTPTDRIDTTSPYRTE